MLLPLVLLVVAQAPPPALPPVAELRGSLVIAGGGTLPAAARERFFALAGKEKARIVVIPTAGKDADDPAKADGFLGPWKKLGPASVVLLHTRDPKAADAAFAKPLADATGVWVSGGDQSRVAAAYKGTPVEKELHALLARGGVLGGTSAGAALVSDPMITGGTEKATTAAGFGFLPGFVLDQHFTQRNRLTRLAGVVESRPGFVGLGVDENTAVIATKRALTVLGDGMATVVIAAGAGRPRLTQTLRSGEAADLFQLRRAATNRAAADPFPPKEPKPPAAEKGSLVIVGGGGLPQEIITRFVELAGGKDSPVVFIPTATEVEVPAADPAEAKLLRRLGAANVTVLHTRDRKTANDPEFSKVLLTAKGVWFGGGRQWRFVDSYAGTLTEKRFHEVLARGGVIGGTSAGASIQGEYMPRGHPLGNTVVSAEGYERGFGFLPGAAVDQHFFARKRTADMTALMKRYPQYLGLGIDEATAVVVRGTTAEVIGKSKAAFYDPHTPPPPGGPDYVEVKAGEKYDLKARRKAE